MTNGWSPQEERLLAQYLIGQVVARATGRGEDECHRNTPRDRYFVGNLRQAGDNSAESMPLLHELISKLSPVALGAEFRLQSQSDTANVRVVVGWACYYRVFPTLVQQLHHQQQLQINNETAADHEDVSRPPSTDETDEEGIQDVSPDTAQAAMDRRRSRTPADRLFIRFRKILCHAEATITLRCQQNDWQVDLSSLETALAIECAHAQWQAMNDPERLRTVGSPDNHVRIPDTALASEEDYRAFLQSLTTDVVPEWAWRVEASLRPNNASPSSGEQILLIQFTNDSPIPEPTDSSRPKPSPNRESFLFDVQVSFEFTGCQVLPFTLELAPRSFRYSRDLWGRGFNSAVERQGENRFSLSHTPVFPQMRYMTRTTPSARFDQLAHDPISG